MNFKDTPAFDNILEKLNDTSLNFWFHLVTNRPAGRPPHDWVFPGHGGGGEVAPPFASDPTIITAVPLPHAFFLLGAVLGGLLILTRNRKG